MNRPVFPALLMTLSLAVLVTDCKSPKRGLRVGNDAATVNVRMANLAASDQNRSGWIYELSDCISTQNGTLGADNIVSFTAIGL